MITRTMTDENQRGSRVQASKLRLNRETVKGLTVSMSKDAKGAAGAVTGSYFIHCSWRIGCQVAGGR